MYLVDQFNESWMRHRWKHKSYSWKHAFLDFMVCVCEENARILYIQINNKQESQREFLKGLLQELVPVVPFRDHHLISMGLRRPCLQCRRFGIKSNTTLCCVDCFAHPSLHKTCFDSYHKRLQQNDIINWRFIFYFIPYLLCNKTNVY
jgi:hypothetical protein